MVIFFIFFHFIISLLRSAALQVIRRLHEMGELAEDLKVKKKRRVVVADEDDEEAEEKSRKYYKKEAPPILTDTSSASLYLHRIDLRLVSRLFS